MEHTENANNPAGAPSALNVGLGKAFLTTMTIIEMQAKQLCELEHENQTLKQAVLGTAEFFEARGYSLKAPAFKKIKMAVEACA